MFGLRCELLGSMCISGIGRHWGVLVFPICARGRTHRQSESSAVAAVLKIYVRLRSMRCAASESSVPLVCR